MGFFSSKNQDDIMNSLSSMMANPSATECALSRQRLDQVIQIQRDIVEEMKENRNQLILHKSLIEKISSVQQDFREQNIVSRLQSIEQQSTTQQQTLEQLIKTLANLDDTIAEAREFSVSQAKEHNQLCENHVTNLDRKYDSQYKELLDKVTVNQIAASKPIAWSNVVEKIFTSLFTAAAVAATMKLISM